MLRFHVDGDIFEMDDSKIMMSEAIVLKKVAGLSPERLFDGIKTRTCEKDSCDGWADDVPCDVDEHKRDMDPESLKALVWLAVRRARGDEAPRYSEFDFNLAEFDFDDSDDDQTDEQTDGEADVEDGRLDPTPAVT